MNKTFNIEEFRDLHLIIKIESSSGKSLDLDPILIAQIDESRVKEELKVLPTQYILFAKLYLDTKKKKDLLEIELDDLKTDYAKEARKDADDANRKITNPEVKDYVSSKEDIREKERELIGLNNQTTQLYYLCKTLDKKYDSLKSLSFMQNKEDKIDNYEDSIEIDPHKYEKHQNEKL